MTWSQVYRYEGGIHLKSDWNGNQNCFNAIRRLVVWLSIIFVLPWKQVHI